MSIKSELTKRKLVEFLVFTAELERKLETIKEMLAEQNDFTPASLYYRFDSKRKGYINQRDVQDFLIDAKIQYTGLDLKILFGRMDENLDGKIVLKEFENFILPNQNSKLRYITMRRPVLIPLPHQKLQDKIEWITSKLFVEIIKEYTKLKQYNTTLISSYDFDQKLIFNLLSKNNEYISFNNIDEFMKVNDCLLETEEIGCIIKLLDSKGNGYIVQQDLKKFLATLNIKKEHEILDQLSPIPAIKNKDKKVTFDMSNSKDRNQMLIERNNENLLYKEQSAGRKQTGEQGQQLSSSNLKNSHKTKASSKPKRRKA